MRVQIRLFAQLRELMGGDIEEQFAADRVTVLELQQRLEETRPLLAPFLPTLAVAVNEEYCIDAATEIGEGDAVALIQPISGGAVPHFLVTPAPLDGDALRDLVRTAASGAVVLFEGAVRDQHQGHAVLRLEYEAYASMAERQLEATGREVLAEFAGGEVHDLAAHHRTGMLELGEASLLVAVSAAHRADAFAAALRAVDRIKETVPVWKKEYGPGGAVWQEGVSPRPAGAEHPAGAS